MSFSLPLGDHVTLSVCVYLPVLQGQIVLYKTDKSDKITVFCLIIYKRIFHGNYFKYCYIYYIITAVLSGPQI